MGIADLAGKEVDAEVVKHQVKLGRIATTRKRPTVRNDGILIRRFGGKAHLRHPRLPRLVR